MAAIARPLPRRNFLRFLLGMLAVPAVLMALTLAADSAYGERILPGVRVAGVPVGGLRPDDARARLVGAGEGIAAREVTVRIGGRTWTATNAALGIGTDVDAALARAAAVGREPDLRRRFDDWLGTAVRGVDVDLPRRAEDGRLALFLADIAREVDRAPVDGSVALTAEGARVTEPRDGVRLDREALRERILSGEDTAERAVAMTPAAAHPAIGLEQMADARAAATAAAQPLAVAAGSERVTLDAARLAAAVRIERRPADGGVVLRARIDDAALDALVAEVASKLDGAAVDASYRPGGAVLEVVPGRDGITVDRDALRASLASAIFADGARVVTASASVVHPSFTTAQAQAAAARMTLVGQYTTSFPVNAARATNIRIGAGRFDGQTVAPGASFSYWDRIGEVSYRTGFVDSGAIIDGRSDTALGGGLCQVSTTFFNAVARAGYQIDERHAHAYYIERYPIGLDAAVFSPGADFRWTNDTAYPVYIRTSASATSVTFWLYSVPTGRSVSFPAAVQSRFVDPAADQPADPAYPKGYVVRGRDVASSRIVVEDGVVIHQDTWYSRYVPVWGGRR